MGEEQGLKRVVILFHDCQRRWRPQGYLIHALSEVWRKCGLDVSCVYGLRHRPEADLLIPQIDLTHLPDDYVEYIRSYRNAVNRDVVDISKRKFSEHLLNEADDYPGPVIVKTDNNFSGLPELNIALPKHLFLSRLYRKVFPLAELAFGRGLARRTVLHEYPVFNKLAEVPRGVFRNKALVVEQFLPERQGALYFLRHYLFLGDHTRSVRVAGSQPFLKRSACAGVDEDLPVPAELIDLRRRLGFDYGKFDYTVHDGKVVILDVNCTPGSPGTPEATAKAARDLAGGIWSLLGEH
jgi:hypothetical protein